MKEEDVYRRWKRVLQIIHDAQQRKQPAVSKSSPSKREEVEKK